MDQPPLNGQGAVDLAAVKARAQQRQDLDAHREQFIGQALTQAGLQCPCGQRIRERPVVYYVFVDTEVPTPQGPQTAMNLLAVTVCSRRCQHAIVLEQQAIARRNGPAGEITWLDERRADRAARNPGQ